MKIIYIDGAIVDLGNDSVCSRWNGKLQIYRVTKKEIKGDLNSFYRTRIEEQYILLREVYESQIREIIWNK